MSKKKNKFDLFDETMKIGTVSTGTMIIGSMPGLLSRSMPGTETTANNIMSKTSRPLGLLPVIQGTSSVFNSIGMLTDIEKKCKRR